MKKRVLALLLCLLVSASLFAGCHGARGLDPFEIPGEFDASRNYEITFWAKNDTNITQVQIYKKAIQDFQTIFPNITVNLRLYTDYARIYNDVITNIATNTTPNVCITYPDHIATYMTGANVVVPLDELMTDGRYGLGGADVPFESPSASQIVPQFLKEGYIGEHCYALPFMRSTEACYINKTYVEKLGFTVPEKLTWDFVWQVSDAAAAKNPDGTYAVNGQNVMIPFIYKSTDNMMIQMTKQLGSGYSDPDGNVMLFNDTTKAQLENIAEHVRRGAFSTFKITGYPANYLNAGQCIFAVDSTAGATWMGSDAPLVDIPEDQIVQFETVVMPIPQFDPEHPQMISQGPSLCIFNKQDPQEVLASWLFAQFLLTNDVQIAYSQTEGYVPVTGLAQESAEYLDYLARSGEDNSLYYDIKLKATCLLLENTENTFVTPVFNGSASLRDAAGQIIENTVKSIRRKETVDDAYYEKMFSDVRSLYRLDQFSGQHTQTSSSDLGPLPRQSVVLLCSLAVIWLVLAVFAIKNRIKEVKNS